MIRFLKEFIGTSAEHKIRINPYPDYRFGLIRIETKVTIRSIRIKIPNPDYDINPVYSKKKKKKYLEKLNLKFKKLNTNINI